MIRACLLSAFAALFAVGPSWAGTGDGAPLAAGPFALDAPTGARGGTILVIDADATCDGAGAAAQAALAEAAGQAVGVVAGAGSACAAAADLLAARQGDGPEIAFSNAAGAFGAAGAPDRWLAERRQRGVYVWDLAAWRALDFAGPRQVLGLFGAAETGPAPSVAEMTEAAVAALSARGEGYFLLVQAAGLDAEARAALDRAGRAGARVIAAGDAERFSALTAGR